MKSPSRPHSRRTVKKRTPAARSAPRKASPEQPQGSPDGVFAQLYERAPVFMALVELETGKVISANAAAMDLSEFAPEEWARRSFAELGWMSREDLDRLAATIRKEGRLTPTEIPCRTKSGKPLDLVYRGEVLHGGTGDMALLTAQDITEHKREQHIARQNEDRYRRLVEISPDAIVVHVNGILRYVNDATLRIYGATSKEQMLGQSVLNFVHPDSRDFVRRRFAMLWDNHRGVPSAQEKFLRLDGTPFDVEVTATPLSYEGERAVLVMVRDITERMRTERTIQRSEVLYRTLFETAHDAIFILGNGVFVDCNPTALAMFNCRREQIVGQFPGALAPEVQPDGRSSREKAFEKIDHAMRGEAQFFEWVHRRPDGTLFDAEVSLNRVDMGSEVVLQAIVRDITERKRSEQTLKATLHEKEMLLREIHHRVKNNMQVISSLLSLQANEATDAGTREGLIDTRNRVRSMALVHEKLYRAGTVGTLDFGEYLKSVVAELARSYQKENIRQEMEAEPVPLEIDVAIPCGLIANEIVSNAFKHAFPDDRQGVIRVALRHHDGQVELSIRDDGVGIPAMADPTTMGSMGMKIIYALAEQISAEVLLDRTHGTEFRIRFTVEKKEGH